MLIIKLKILFPPTIWLNFSASIFRKTNNFESIQTHFNELFYKSHPHINTLKKFNFEYSKQRILTFKLTVAI